MHHFTDPHEQAIYRYLIGPDTTTRGSATPAGLPARHPAGAHQPTAADIARTEGLDLGPELQRLTSRTRQRTAPAAGRPDSPRAARAVHQAVLQLIRQACPRLPHAQAAATAAQWARATSSPAEATAWIQQIGWHRPQAAAALRAHGITPPQLDTLVDGTRARIRVRDGESAGRIIAALHIPGQPGRTT